MIRTPNGLAALFGRLTDPKDRETYAALISFVDSLPEGDELSRIVELCGLLSLVGQRIPDAAAELLVELRAQIKAAGDYYAQVDTRLASLPQEIAAGFDAGEIAQTISELFRQQIAAAGLRDSAVSLDLTAKAVKGMLGEITTTLQPASEGLKAVTATVTTDLARLAEASREIQRHNHRLILRDHSQRGLWQGFAALCLFLIGGVAGILLEKRQTSDVLRNIGAQIERVQTPALPHEDVPRKTKKGMGL